MKLIGFLVLAAILLNLTMAYVFVIIPEAIRSPMTIKIIISSLGVAIIGLWILLLINIPIGITH